MKSTAYAKALVLALTACAILSAPAVAQQQLPTETFTVTVDVFSGRRNPMFTLTANEFQAVSPALRVLCTSGRVAPFQYPDSLLGYRGVLIQRGGGYSVYLTRTGTRFAGNNPPSICQDQVQATGDLFVADLNSGFERQLLDMALQKGVLDKEVHAKILARLSGTK